MAIKVVIADDHKLILNALTRALEHADDFDVVGQTESGAHVLPLVGRTSPDLVLMDIHMPGMGGLQCLDLIRERHPQTKVVLISASTDHEDIQRAAQGSRRLPRQEHQPRRHPRCAASGVRGDRLLRAGTGRDVGAAPGTDRRAHRPRGHELGVADLSGAVRYAHQHGLTAGG